MQNIYWIIGGSLTLFALLIILSKNAKKSKWIRSNFPFAFRAYRKAVKADPVISQVKKEQKWKKQQKRKEKKFWKKVKRDKKRSRKRKR